MHWTQSVLLALTMLCLIGNAVRIEQVGCVRPIGLAVCLSWLLQYAVWLQYGEQIPLFLACDAVVLWFAFRGRHWTDRAVAALMLVCWAALAATYFRGPEKLTWYIGWVAVVIQAILSQPWPATQRMRFSISHGPRWAT